MSGQARDGGGLERVGSCAQQRVQTLGRGAWVELEARALDWEGGTQRSEVSEDSTKASDLLK